MITPELLSSVFNKDITEVTIEGDTVYWYTKDGGIARSNINIYQLAYKNCKEWALKDGWELSSKSYFMYDGREAGSTELNDEVKTLFDATSELKSVFGMCQHIFEEYKDKK